MSWTVELTWNCSSCDSRNILGRHKTCPKCGSPREKGEMQMNESGVGLPAVTDANLLAIANAGPDWFCTHCDAGNSNKARACAKCGAVRNSNANRAETKQADTARPAQAWGARVVVGGMALAFVALCSSFFYTRDIPATVTKMTWTHTTIQETWTPTTDSDWRYSLTEKSEIPPTAGRGERAGVDIISCYSKEHHKDRYQCGSHQECSPTYRTESYSCGTTCSHNGNGFATCHAKTCTRSVRTGESCHTEADYCYRPVFQDYCEYRTQVWKETNSNTALGSGSDEGITWPILPMTERQRLREIGTWKVTFTFGEDYVLDTDRAAYNSWQAGDAAVVEKRLIGGVRAVRKPESKI